MSNTMPHNKSLDKDVSHYRQEVVHKHDRQLSHFDLNKMWIQQNLLQGNYCPDHTPPEYWDWPAVAVICSGGGKKSHDMSRSVKAPHVVEPLKSKILTLGDIGKPRVIKKGKNKLYSKNVLGRCAEQHAANGLYKKGIKTQIDKIDFSKAIRPRTNEPISYCDNCQLIFGLVTDYPTND